MFHTLPDDILRLLFQYIHVADMVRLQFIYKRNVYGVNMLQLLYSQEEVIEQTSSFYIRTFMDTRATTVVTTIPHNHTYKITTKYNHTHTSHIFVKQQFLRFFN